MRLLLPLLLSMAVLTGTMPCSCWAALLPAPPRTEAASVQAADAEACPCCRAKKLATSHKTPAPDKPAAPKCPPGCFTCLGAVTPSPVPVPVVSLPEPGLDETPAALISLTSQTTSDRSVPPPRAGQ